MRIVVALILIVVVVAGVLLFANRPPREDEGIQSFRRHIDALSPEARHDVMERARRYEQGKN